MGLSLRRRAHSPGPSYVLPRCHPSFRHPRDDGGDEDALEEAKGGWVIYPPSPASPEPPPSVEGALGPIAFLQPPRDQNRPALRPGGRGGPAAVAAPRQPFGSAAGSGGLAGCHVGHGICLPRLLRCPPIFEQRHVPQDIKTHAPLSATLPTESLREVVAERGRRARGSRVVGGFLATRRHARGSAAEPAEQSPLPRVSGVPTSNNTRQRQCLWQPLSAGSPLVAALLICLAAPRLLLQLLDGRAPLRG